RRSATAGRNAHGKLGRSRTTRVSFRSRHHRVRRKHRSMSSNRRSKDEAAISAEDVAEFLGDHPDFFEAHPQLAARLRIPHSTGEAVSLIEKQVDILRRQNTQLERKLVDLIEVARANDAAVERIHQLVLAVMEAEDLPDLLHGLAD